ncbi:GntR family transcriptional regulator, partial [Streptomyces hainanensis]|uniref:GntR family transcriptional regulator n=1 Tax=Streptomyces hainanensis TaxID=402648 RepID=UPI003C7E0B7B
MNRSNADRLHRTKAATKAATQTATKAEARTQGGAAADEAPAGAGGASDFLQLDVTAAPPGGRADWLARQLRGAVADGRLPVGSRLPATRVLAGELGVSRGVVTEAYRRLVEDGHAEERPAAAQPGDGDQRAGGDAGDGHRQQARREGPAARVARRRRH